MTLSELCNQVLELDAKATKGPWKTTASEGCTSNNGCRAVTDFFGMNINCVFIEDAELIAQYRTACVKLALACQLLDALAAELEQWGGDKISVIPSIALKHYGEIAATFRADVQKIVEGPCERP